MSRSTSKRSTSSTRSRSARGARAKATSSLPARGSGSSSSHGKGRKEHLTGAAIERSCGSVFEDLGFSREEAVSLDLRSFLSFRLEEFIKDQRFTQRQAAAFFGVSQPRISNLVRGRIDLFSLDTLVDMLTRAGIKVEILLQGGIRRSRGKVRWQGDLAERRRGRVADG